MACLPGAAMVNLVVLVALLKFATSEYNSPVRMVLEQNVNLAQLELFKNSLNIEELEAIFLNLPFVQTSRGLFNHGDMYKAPSNGGTEQNGRGLGTDDFASNVVMKSTEVLRNSEYNVSTECLNDVIAYLEGVTQLQQWALQLLDAQAKLPSGILTGNRFWLGSYSGCLNVTSVSNQSDADVFKGRYCVAQIPLSPTGGNQISFITMGLEIGLCVPSSCNTADVNGLINTALSLVPLNTTKFQPTVNCPEKLDVGSDGRAIVAIVILSIIGFFIVFGTLYDIGFIQIPIFLKTLPKGDLKEKIHVNQPDEDTLLLNNDKSKNIKAVEPVEAGVLGKTFLAFSFYTNGRKLLNTAQAPGSLTCIHGIRFLSMTWVILGHGFVISLLLTDNFVEYVPQLQTRWTFQAVLNGTFSVDSFFFLSGLLVAYLTLKEMKKSDGKINWGLFYFHRFWRLTPPYMLVLMVDVCLIRYLGEGPLWPQQGLERNYCKDSWWQNLLYINNFFPFQKMCMSWSWYLSNDMQFYIISPVVLIPLFRSKRIGGMILLVLLLASYITTGVISTVNNLSASGNDVHVDLSKPNLYQDIYYVRPYCRIGPYLVGIIIGYILYESNGKIRINKKLVFLGWIAAFVCNLSVLYGLYGNFNTAPLSVGVSAFYNTVARTAWAIGLAWVVIACTSGYGARKKTPKMNRRKKEKERLRKRLKPSYTKTSLVKVPKLCQLIGDKNTEIPDDVVVEALNLMKKFSAAECKEYIGYVTPAEFHLHSVNPRAVQRTPVPRTLLSINIHPLNRHWVTSCFYPSSQKVVIYDSMKCPAHLKQVYSQLKLVYGHLPPESIDYANVTQQSTSPICGVMAISYAFAVFLGKNPVKLNFDIISARDHLRHCLQQRRVLLFPLKPESMIQKPTWSRKTPLVEVFPHLSNISSYRIPHLRHFQAVSELTETKESDTQGTRLSKKKVAVQENIVSEEKTGQERNELQREIIHQPVNHKEVEIDTCLQAHTQGQIKAQSISRKKRRLDINYRKRENELRAISRKKLHAIDNRNKIKESASRHKRSQDKEYRSRERALENLARQKRRMNREYKDKERNCEVISKQRRREAKSTKKIITYWRPWLDNNVG